MRTKQMIRVSFVFLFLVSFAYTALAGPPEPSPTEKGSDAAEISEEKIAGLSFMEVTHPGQHPYTPDGQDFVEEVEPNGTPATATALGGSNVVALGNIFPNADEDYYSFTADAGDRVYAAVMTSFSANASSDSQLYLYDVDGTTLLEFDEDDGSLGGLSSSIAGRVLPNTGTYYLRVKHFSATSQLRPYHLHVQVQSGAPVPETEPNETGEPLPASGWVSGVISATTDFDVYTLSLNAGDTVFLSLDLDPERDTVTWNGRLGIGPFNGFVLIVNDASVISPNSEATFMTVRDSGAYFVYVDQASGAGPTATYHLSVSVHPAEAQSCTTYTSTDTPIPIADAAITTSSITIPGNPRIGDLNVAVDLTHANMPDLDVSLISPQGNHNGLFTDIGSSTQVPMNLIIDDEAGIPFGLYTVVSGMRFQPELAYRLSWFDGEDAGGTWTLELRDDAAANTGTLNSWSIILCDPPPPPACPEGTVQSPLYVSDFEADDGGFTHSGIADEWEWGLPTFAPITTCNSGTNCWKTDLDNTYDASSNQDLLSPVINLAGAYTFAWVEWSQRSQLENATFDHASATVREVGGANPRTLWQWLDATQTNTIGTPGVTIQESSGWGLFTADISDYIGQTIELVYHLDSDTTVQLAGYAVDDVAVYGCLNVGAPQISLSKTVGTDPTVCATTDTINVAPGTDVTYCYEVTNTGSITLTQHDLTDSELGTILDDFSYSLSPGASAFLTVTVNINATTVNTATWTAFNPGPMDETSATDVATVIVTGTPIIDVAPLNLSSTQYPDTVTTQTLTISNLGNIGLDWNIDEDAGSGAPLGGWADNFDSYATGSQLHGQGGWKGWDNNPAFGALTSDTQARSTPNSAAIVGASDLVHPYSGYTSGQWVYTAWQYIPSGYAGQTYFILLNTYNDSGPYSWSAQVCFNSTTGLLYDDTLANCASGTTLPILYNQWVEIRVEIDLDADTQAFYYNNQLLYQDSWTNHVSTGGVLNIGAVDLFANGATTVYYDDVSLLPPVVPPAVCDVPEDILWATVDPASGTTASGESSEVEVTFDSTGLSAGTYTGTLCVTSNDPATPLVTVPLSLTVEAYTYGVELSGDDAASGLPGDTVTYVVIITNTGNTSDTFDLAAVSVWDTLLSDTSITLGAGQSTTFEVAVDIPGDAEIGDSDTATVTATSQGDDTLSASVNLVTTATDIVFEYGVALSADQAASGAPGDTISYVIVITNTGNTTDTFDLSAAGVWAALLSDTSITLGAGESTTFTVDVTVAAGASDGDSDVTTVTATSQNDATATGSVTLTTTAEVPTVEGNFIYLPIVINP